MLAAQLAEALLGRVFQVVGALVVDHYGEQQAGLHRLHVLGQPPALVLTAVRVEPGGHRRTKDVSQVMRLNSFLSVNKTSRLRYVNRQGKIYFCGKNTFWSSVFDGSYAHHCVENESMFRSH